LNENVILANRITNDVLSFSRKSSEELESINAEDLKNDVIRFIKNLLHSRVTLVKKVQDNQSDKNLFVNIRHNHLHQILINVVNNALHAMKEKGTLTLHWHYEDINSADAVDLGLKTGEYLCIGIEDNGCGMNEKTMTSAFDPFFSTKAPDEGTGLGLSISYRIVKEWGGTMTIKSQENKGSIIMLHIPVCYKK
jgi:C4-dicarboxylate-specific signal transduction histidine kinase